MRAARNTALLALLITLAVGSALMLVVGRSPGTVWLDMITRTLGRASGLGDVLYRATSLIFAGLAVSIALDAGLFNIGVEAQLTAGVVACGAVGALPAGTPAIIAVPMCAIAAAGAGAAIGAIIGGLRVWRGAHEVITSIMLDAVVAGVALWLGNAALFEPGAMVGPPIAAGAELPALPIAGTAANASIAIALAAALALWWLRDRTTWGRAWLAVGQAPEAARAVGIPVGRVQLWVMTGAGALAGLAACNLVMGDKHALQEGLGRGTGLIGISVALLARKHPLAVVGAALLLGFLGAGGLKVNDEVPKELTEVLQGVVLLAVAGTTAWSERARLRGGERL